MEGGSFEPLSHWSMKSGGIGIGLQAMPFLVHHPASVVLLCLLNRWEGRCSATKIRRSGLFLMTLRNFVRSAEGHQPFTSM